MDSRLPSYALSIGVVLAMLSPALRRPPVDGFPLSTYPMFAAPRESTAKIYTVLAITEAGDVEVLTPKLIGGDRWASLAKRTLDEAAQSKAKRRALCETVAERVAADPARADLHVALEFVSEVYDTHAYFSGDTEPRSRKLLASCPVPR
jgi:hypothetical protein